MSRSCGAASRCTAPPSVTFTPDIYTPLYFVVAAVVSVVAGTGFVALRLVSIVASLVLLAALAKLAHRETDDRVAGLVAAGLFAACYRISGAWLDIAREDTLCLALLFCGLVVARDARTARRGVAAGVLMSLSFLTKQVALLPALGVGVFLVVARRGRSTIVGYIGDGRGRHRGDVGRARPDHARLVRVLRLEAAGGAPGGRRLVRRLLHQRSARAARPSPSSSAPSGWSRSVHGGRFGLRVPSHRRGRTARRVVLGSSAHRRLRQRAAADLRGDRGAVRHRRAPRAAAADAHVARRARRRSRACCSSAVSCTTLWPRCRAGPTSTLGDQTLAALRAAAPADLPARPSVVPRRDRPARERAVGGDRRRPPGGRIRRTSRWRRSCGARWPSSATGRSSSSRPSGTRTCPDNLCRYYEPARPLLASGEVSYPITGTITGPAEVWLPRAVPDDSRLPGRRQLDGRDRRADSIGWRP